jgi:cell division protein FtsN
MYYYFIMIKKSHFQKELQQLQSEQGNILLGMVIGLVIGLGIALSVAYFIHKNPPTEKLNVRPPELSFVPKLNADGTTTNELRDPNTPLHSKPKIPESSANNQNTPTSVIESTTPEPEVKASATYWLQIGAYSDKAYADSQKAQLAMQGLQARITENKIDGQSTWRVRIGPYTELPDLNDDKNKLDNSGISYSVIKANKP